MGDDLRKKLKDLMTRQDQQKLKEMYGSPDAPTIEAFISLPYWARYDLGLNYTMNSTIFGYYLDDSFLTREPHSVHKSIPIDSNSYDEYILESILFSEKSWSILKMKYEWSGTTNPTRSAVGHRKGPLCFPCVSNIVIDQIFAMIAAMSYEVTSFTLDSDRKEFYICLDDHYSFGSEFKTEYQAILMIYGFVWEKYKGYFTPSLSDFKGDIDISNDINGNFIEIRDSWAFAYFLQDFASKFARHGEFLDISYLQQLQRGAKVHSIKIGKVSLIEGDFSVIYSSK